jgi:hypothetical protein
MWGFICLLMIFNIGFHISQNDFSFVMINEDIKKTIFFSWWKKFRNLGQNIYSSKSIDWSPNFLKVIFLSIIFQIVSYLISIIKIIFSCTLNEMKIFQILIHFGAFSREVQWFNDIIISFRDKENCINYRQFHPT